jgi:hypothetical protein
MSKSLVSSIEAHDCVRTTYYKIKLSDECLADLQEYSAKVLLSPSVYEDYTHRLAGHIKGGKQLQIPLETKETKDLLKVLSSAAVQYYNNYISRVITNYSKIPSERNPYALKGVEVQDLWLNSYLAGDYNPIHKHGTYSPVGLSCFIFVSIPDSIKAKNNQARIASRSGGITGNDHYDGHTLLKWGYNFASDNVYIQVGVNLKVAHIADTHIRNYNYHKEYREIFDQIYDRLRKEKVDYIVHCGDLAHTKTQLSPEYFDLATSFLKNLADIAPTYIILGNHDGNLKNEHRQDAITPIVNALRHPDLNLLKNSGEIHGWAVLPLMFSRYLTKRTG